jgi:hypothetical protein
MSPLLDSAPTEISARTRTDTTTTPGDFRGTDGSNPVPSSAESGANFRSLQDCLCHQRARQDAIGGPRTGTSRAKDTLGHGDQN